MKKTKQVPSGMKQVVASMAILQADNAKRAKIKPVYPHVGPRKSDWFHNAVIERQDGECEVRTISLDGDSDEMLKVASQIDRIYLVDRNGKITEFVACQ